MKLFDVYPLYDITPVRGRGSWLWDDKGKKYLDLYGGHAVISIGHSHPHYVNRLQRQLKELAFYSNAVKMPLQEKLAELLGEMSGYPDYSLFLSNSGAEANENALKLASFHNGRRKIVAIKGAFHGRTSLAVAVTDNPSIQAPVNHGAPVEFVPMNDEIALKAAMNTEVCALIIEGIQGVAGIYEPNEAFLQLARTLCDELGAVLILDEVQSGYGRSGKFFAHQHGGIQADIVTIAKGMGNGFPIGGTLIAPKFQPKHGMLGTTFGGNYLACAAAISVLEVIRDEQLIANATAMGEYVIQKLKGLQGVKEVRGRGLMIGIELNTPCAPIRLALLKEHGIFTGNASQPNTLRLLPGLNVGKQELDLFIEALQTELQKTTES